MIKVAMIGAGSVVFSKNLTVDILHYPEFKNATFAYMDIDKDRLQVGAALCKKAAKAVGANPKIIATMDRREALKDADFVINMVQIGGFDSTLVDFEIPRKYGLNFTIADTTGPGGLFRALRTYPMLKGLGQDMMELCPNAWLLNYSNPMSMNMQTLSRAVPGLKAVGLCHSVQGTLNQIMGYIGENPLQVEFVCAGINHMAFYLKLLKDKQDLYPRLFEAMDKPKVFNTNRVRFELMRRLGYFVTESSEHSSEYCPYFIPRGAEMVKKFAVPLDEYLRRCDGIVDEFDRMKKFVKSDKPLVVHGKSHEYGSTIIHSTVTGNPSVVYGNMPNKGAITNLPDDAIAEVPTLVDRNGCQFTTVGALPTQLVGYMMPHIIQHDLFIRAAMEGRIDHVYQACMFDPLTAATLSLDKMVEMCDEMIASHGKLLPKLQKKSLVPGSGIAFKPVKAKTLRESWDKVHHKGSNAKDSPNEFIESWHIVGPFESAKQGEISLDDPTPVEAAFKKLGVGNVDLKAGYSHKGQELKWKSYQVQATNGQVNLTDEYGYCEWSIAYGYAEFESIHARDTVLRCGSDDGIKIWLNGKLVHENETGRGYSPNIDEVNIHLEAGVNRILVKIDNYTSGWSFGVSIDKPNF